MEDFDKILCSFKSKTITIKHKDKVLKKGILVDWKCQPFFMEIYLKTEKREEKVKLFYPFSYEHYGDDVGIHKPELYMDYRIVTFNEGIGRVFDNDILKISHHKFLDSIVSITSE